MNKQIIYTRVLPRDLFNESKLLKCVGRLCLLIHDGLTPEMKFSDSGESFEIAMLIDGSLTINNLEIFIKGKPFLFKTIYNSKDNYPLYLEHKKVDYLVFDESGNFDSDFIEFCKTIRPQGKP